MNALVPPNWIEMADWMQQNGYPLLIETLPPGGEYKYRASIEGEGTRYGDSMKDVVRQVYAWVTREDEFTQWFNAWKEENVHYKQDIDEAQKIARAAWKASRRE